MAAIFYHGTRADLRPGDLIMAGHASNFGSRKLSSWGYMTETLDAAMWGGELALGEDRERIYVVEPTGPIENDLNLTDKKLPGNPTRSFRSHEPLRVLGEVTHGKGMPPNGFRR